PGPAPGPCPGCGGGSGRPRRPGRPPGCSGQLSASLRLPFGGGVEERSGNGSGEVGAAVDVLGGAGQVAGLFGGQEREQGGDVVHRGMPAGPSSRASALVKPSTAALAEEYGVLPNTPPPCCADTEDMFSTRP